MTTHSSILAWEIPWTENLVGYSPGGCKRVGQDLVTKQQRTNSVCMTPAEKTVLASMLIRVQKDLEHYSSFLFLITK